MHRASFLSEAGDRTVPPSPAAPGRGADAEIREATMNRAMLRDTMSPDNPSFRLHGPAEPRQPLVLDSPHSGFEFPADFGAVVSEFELRDGEDCFVDELWMPATERGIGLIAARAPRTYIDCNRHAGDIDLALIEGGHVARRARAERQGAARQGADLAHPRRRRRHLRPQARRRRGAAPHRALSPAVSPRPAGADRGDARALRRQLAHRLSFDERRRWRAGRRRPRRRARRHRARRSRRHDLRLPASPSSFAPISQAAATTSRSTIRTRASSWCAPTRTRRNGA